MNILNKLAFATATFTLSCAVLSSAPQAKAATLGGTFDFIEPGFILDGIHDHALTGTFSGEDINGNGILEKQELSAFSVLFPGLGIAKPFSLSLKDLTFFSYDGREIQFGALGIETFPPGPDYLNVSVVVIPIKTEISESGQGFGSLLVDNDNPPWVTKVSSIPEPDENGAVLGAVGLVGFLLKKRIASTKATQLKTQE